MIYSMFNELPPPPNGLESSPETLLMMAVLQDAFVTFQRGLGTLDPEALEAFREVDRWFRSRESDWPFSFESICESLNIGVSRVRRVLNGLMRDSLMPREVHDMQGMHGVRIPHGAERRRVIRRVHNLPGRY